MGLDVLYYKILSLKPQISYLASLIHRDKPAEKEFDELIMLLTHYKEQYLNESNKSNTGENHDRNS